MNTRSVPMQAFLRGVLISAALHLGCSKPGSSSSACEAGTDCVCDGASCEVSCGGSSNAGCAFKCQGGATCAFTCQGGGCTTECSASSSCEVSCAGGNCSTTCTDAAHCSVACGGDGCDLSCGSTTHECLATACINNCTVNCGGAGSCANSCLPATGCAINP